METFDNVPLSSIIRFEIDGNWHYNLPNYDFKILSKITKFTYFM